MTPEERQRFIDLHYSVGEIFTPNVPINEKDLFSGRKEQITRVVDVIFQKGQHAIIFGERGVGKTSLANVLSSFINNPANPILSPRVNCDKADDFTTLWRKIFDGFQLLIPRKTVGFMPSIQQEEYSSKTLFGDRDILPDDVKKTLYSISKAFIPFVIIDDWSRGKCR